MAPSQVILNGQTLSGSEIVTVESVSPAITPNGGSDCQIVINGAGITEGTTIACSDGTIAVDMTSSAAAMTQTPTLLGRPSTVSSTNAVSGTIVGSRTSTLSGTNVASATISGTSSIPVLPPSSNVSHVVSSTFTGGVAGSRIGFAGVAGFLGVMVAL